MLLPGPEAAACRLHRLAPSRHAAGGGLVAGTLFILPGFVAIMVLSILYVFAQSRDATVLTHLVAAVFYGLKLAVAAIVTEAVIRIGKKVLKNRVMVAIAALAFVGIFFFELPFPVIILAAGVTGFGGLAENLSVIKQHGEGPADEQRAVDAAAAKSRPTVAKSLLISAVWLTLWFAPLGFLAWWLGPDSVFVKEGIFFSQAAVMTFGGAYSVLVLHRPESRASLRLAEAGGDDGRAGDGGTRRRLLIMVVQFVGFLGPPKSWLVTAARRRKCLCGHHGLGHVRPLFFLDLSRSPLYQMPPRQSEISCRTLLHHGCRRGGRAEPGDLVRHPCALRGRR